MKKPKRPRGVSQLAKMMVDIASGEDDAGKRKPRSKKDAQKRIKEKLATVPFRHLSRVGIQMEAEWYRHIWGAFGRVFLKMSHSLYLAS